MHGRYAPARYVMQNTRIQFLQRVFVFTAALGALIALNLIWVIPTLQSSYVSASVLALEIDKRARADVEFALQTAQHGLADAAEEIAYDPSHQQITAELALKQNPAIKNIGFVDKDGKETFLVDRFDFISPSDLRRYETEHYFITALAGEAAFGDVFLSAASEPHIMLAAPVVRAGEVDGVLVSEINIRSLISAIRTPESRFGHIYAVDKSGYQILHPDVSEILRRPNFANRAIVAKVIQRRIVADGLKSEDAYINEQGTDVFTVGMPVGVADLSIFFEQPRNVALAGARQVILFAVLTTLLGAVALFMIMRGRIHLQSFNRRLNELLHENYEVGKMMVRRDLELTRANARLEELDAIKTEFVSIAAHQLRTPLTGIRWSYQALLDGESGAVSREQRHLLESGLGATLRMVDLVNDLLSVARIEEGKFGIRLRKQSLAPLLTRLIGRYAALAEQKGVHFSSVIPADLPDVAFDEEKMEIVYDNLLDNSLKYTEPNGTIGLKVSYEKGSVCTEISDTGVGISQDQIHRVFTKFFRADNALRLHTSGTGLGLYVVKNIVEKHGGSVDVESHEGKGSTFRVILPAA